jgi:hypothetical protein
LANVIAVAVAGLAGPVFPAASVALEATMRGCSVPSTVQVL